MNVPSPADIFAAFFAAEHQAEPEPGQVYYGPCGRPEPGTEADPDLGHGYDGPELRSGTPEYEAGYAEYQAWAGQAGPENEPVPYTLTAQAEAALDAAEPEAEP